MAHSFDTNTIPTTGAVSVYKLLAIMLLQTWTKIDSSDGVTAYPGGQVVSGAAGATGLGNTSAWYVIRDPNGVRSFCFQRGTTNREWRVKYSKAAGFVGGTPGITQTPSAADEKFLYGGGLDASPTYTTIFSADGGYYFNCCAGDTTVGYGWWWHSFQTGNPTGSNQGGMMLDILLAGSYPASDIDPAVIYVPETQAAGIFGIDMTTSLNTKGYLGTTFQTMTSLSYRTAGDLCFPAHSVSSGVDPNPFTLKDDAVPVPYGRSMQQSTIPFGYKGIGTLLSFSGTWRDQYDTVNTTGPTSRDKVWVNGALLPWDGSVPITV